MGGLLLLELLHGSINRLFYFLNGDGLCTMFSHFSPA